MILINNIASVDSKKSKIYRHIKELTLDIKNKNI